MNKYFDFELVNNLQFNKNDYKYLYNKNYKHFKKKFLENQNKSNYQNYLYKIPYNIDLEFMFNYYNVNNKLDKQKIFLKKYINQSYIIHYPFQLENYNLGFIYSFYLSNKIYNLNFLYNFINKLKDESGSNTSVLNTDVIKTELSQNRNDNELYINSRKLIIKSDKNIKPIVFVFYINGENINEQHMQTIQILNKIKNYYKLIIILNKNQSQSINNIESLDVIYVSKSISLYEKYMFGYDHLVNKYFKLNNNFIEQLSFCFLNDNIIINNNIVNIFNYFYTIQNNILSVCDTYISEYDKYFYSFSSDFIIIYNSDNNFFRYKKNKYSYNSFIKYCFNNDLLNAPIGFISIDHFMPLYSRNFQNINILNKNHMLFRHKSPIYLKDNLNYINIIEKCIGNPNLNPKLINIAFIIHIGNIENNIYNDNIFVEILKVLSNKDKNHNFILFITIIESIVNEVTEKIYEYLQDWISFIYIVPIENIGADLYPFIYIIDNYLIKNSKIFDFEFDYILKYHTKTDKIWRQELMTPFKNNLDICCKLLLDNENIGVVCSGEFIINFDFIDNDLFLEFCKNKKIDSTLYSDSNFVGGTIFMIKSNLLLDFFKMYNISINTEKEYFNIDYSLHYKHSEILYVHLWERILSGIIPSSFNKIIFGI
jgi:hypothetical protein